MYTNKTVSDPTMPNACSVVTQTDGTATVYYNTGGTGAIAAQTTHHGKAVTIKALQARAVSLTLDLNSAGGGAVMTRSKKGQYCSGNHASVLSKFVAKSLSAADETAALTACETFCLSNAACSACSVDQIHPAPNQQVQWVAIPKCGIVEHWAGALAGDISEKKSPGDATITLSGPSDRWFGVGFNAQVMSDSPYTLVVNASGVFEQKIGDCGSEAEHCVNDPPLASSITLKSNSEVNGVRTVVVTRPYGGLTKDHYTFDPDFDPSINIISAIGKDQIFAYHVAHDASVITVTTPGVATPVCDTGGEGKLCSYGGVGCGSFTKNCLSHSKGGDLLAQKNPTCNSNHYSGGLQCCHHNRIMLDEDQIQQQSLDRETLNYHMKFRFWFKEYVPSGSSVTPQVRQLFFCAYVRVCTTKLLDHLAGFFCFVYLFILLWQLHCYVCPGHH